MQIDTQKLPSWEKVLPPESNTPIYFSNPQLAPYLQNPLTYQSAKEILNRFPSSFNIDLNQNGFPPAAERDVETDDTNYHAIWVRDSAWVYFYFKVFSPEKARTLINRLVDYYISEKQHARFLNIISTPELAKDKIQVPHIRFDGTDKDLDDVIVDGKPEIWNHKQMDAHGLFLLALADAFQSGWINAQHHSILASLIDLFIQFFEVIEYYHYEDAGAWEEIDKVNTSSIALVTNALFTWQKIADEQQIILSQENKITPLAEKGLQTIKTNLHKGGESTGYDKNDLRYRQADAALLHILTPVMFSKLEQKEYQIIFDLIETTLLRTHGVIRYVKDSYQSGNYWLKTKKTQNEPSLTGDSSDAASFQARENAMPAHTEAEWFFDSMLALAYINCYQSNKLPTTQRNIKAKAAYHIKRALAQMTKSNTLAADGALLKGELLPESINTLKIKDQKHYAPSPITPLNWAKASLALALNAFISLDKEVS